jgi:hypothetical protein
LAFSIVLSINREEKKFFLLFHCKSAQSTFILIQFNRFIAELDGKSFSSNFYRFYGSRGGKVGESISGAKFPPMIYVLIFPLRNRKSFPVPPTQVTIAGPTEARQGDTVNFQCLTAPSNPAAEIRWTIDGRQRRTNVSSTIPSNEGGVITTSNISITVDSSKRQFSLLCQGINMQLADNVMTTHTLHILCEFFSLNCAENAANLIFFSSFFPLTQIRHQRP